MSLMDKLKKNSKIKETIALEDSTVFATNGFITSPCPLLNLALSGSVDGGLASGLTMIAGPSKHFKTSYSLLLAAAFQKKHKDGVILFYDSEYGATAEYFQQFGIDTNRVLHTPIMNIEELKFDLAAQLENIEKKDNVFILIDSVGNLASKKEVEDALAEKSAADMTRAKQLKSLWRIATPYLKKFDIPLVAINHTYKEQSLFPKDIVSGGTGGIYSSDTIIIVGKSQNKKGTEIQGYNFTLNIEKSRFVKEKSKFAIKVNWEGGVVLHSGLLEDAQEGGYVDKPKAGWYTRPSVENDKNYREVDTETAEFWEPIFNNTDFKAYLSKKYKIVSGDLINDGTDNVDDREVEMEIEVE